MRENNGRTDTNPNADASVELFTYDSECSLVVAHASFRRISSRVGGSTRHGSGLRGVRNGRCGPVRARPVISQDHDRDCESAPATPRQVSKIDGPRNRTQERRGEK